MKYLLMVGDGMADFPLPDQGNRTPLQIADTPNMDFLADRGEIGMVKTVPEKFKPGSDVANLSLLGYDPQRYYTGRAAFEALGMELKPEEAEVFYRCNLVKLDSAEDFETAIMEDFSGGHITTAASRLLIDALNRAVRGESKWSRFRFSTGVSYRHLLRWKEGDDQAQCTPPHDIIGQPVAPYLPQAGSAAPLLVELQSLAAKVMHDDYPEAAANAIWLWGQGKKPEMD
ncbi:MAG: phosphoglycerate mutase, partial [bacterium]